jgi:hypothetical protein
MRRSGQGHAAQEHEPSPLHRTITTPQHDCHLDGTAMIPSGRKDRIMLRIEGQPVSRVRIA